MSGASNAYEIVTEAHNKYLGKAENFLSQANNFVSQLAGFQATPSLIGNISFNMPSGNSGFHRPAAPQLSGGYTVNIPEAPPLPPAYTPGALADVSVPEFTEQTPVISYGPRPAAPHIPVPVSPAKPVLPTMPEEPDWERPEPVTLASLNLPSMPDIQIPAYTARAPQAPIFDLHDNFSRFTPEQYVSQLLARIEQRVMVWMQGEEALPAAIEQALFGRGRTRIERERAALEQQAYDDFAARGFSAPNGVLTARLDAIRQNAQDKTAEFNRDAMLKSFDEALANMRLAVQQGIQLEGVKANLHMELQRIELQSLTHLRDTAVAILNARIAYFNAEVQGVQTEAQVFEARLKAELSKLDVMRTQVEMEKLKGETNQQRVDMYKAQWDAVRSMAAWYSERVNAYKTQADTAKLPIEIFAQEVQAFETMHSAYGKQIDAWRAEIEAEQSKAQVYKATADAYASRVQGVAAIGNLYNDRERMRIQQHGQALEQYGMQIRRVDQIIKAQEAELSARLQQDRAKVDMYRASADVEQAASAAADRQFNSQLAAARASVDAALEQARLQSQENTALLGLQLEAMKSIAQIMSQLAASSMSAINYGASLSGSISESYGRQLSWSGDVADHSGAGW